jgi:glycosyltransferase involved in cell wall biosynthesis
MFFSIVVPTYNRAAFIDKTLRSLISHGYNNYEILVIDDGSTDETEEIVKQFQHSQIKYHKIENGERGRARNYGASVSMGDYINFFDSDDLAYSNHISAAFDFIKENNNPEVIHMNYDAKDVTGKMIHKGVNFTGDVSSKLIKENLLSCNGVFIRKDIAMEYRFPEDRRMAVSEDWALWLILGSHFPIWHCNVVTSTVVVHDERSILDWNPDKVITRDTMLIDFLLKDRFFLKKYKHGIGKFIADRYTFFMLLLAIKKRNNETIKYAIRAIKSDFTVIVRKRFLASLLKLIK